MPCFVSSQGQWWGQLREFEIHASAQFARSLAPKERGVGVARVCQPVAGLRVAWLIETDATPAPFCVSALAQACLGSSEFHQPASLAGRFESEHDSDSYVVENAPSFVTSHTKVSTDTIVQ
jgi:hypothetical protein